MIQPTMKNAFISLNFQNKIAGLRFMAFLFIVVGFFFIYGEFTKATFRSPDDLIFVNGPFKNYLVYNAGKTHRFSFRLKNYSNNFIINNDYLHLLRFANFNKIGDGQNIKVGFLEDSEENLNVIGENVYVYAISENDIDFFDTKNAIKQYNNKNMLLFGLSLFVCAIISYSYSVKLSKLAA